MPQQLINLGAAANDGTGDTLREGAEKINENFTEVYQIAAEAQRVTGNAVALANGFETWAELDAFTEQTAVDDRTTVFITDTGTHARRAGDVGLDGNPVAEGGQTPNAGRYINVGGVLIRYNNLDSQDSAGYAAQAQDVLDQAVDVIDTAKVGALAELDAAGDVIVAAATEQADRATLQKTLTDGLVTEAQAAALSVNAAPLVPPSDPAAFFGQESADKLVATQAKLNLPANVLALPAAGTDWIFGITCRLGNQFAKAEYETLLSRGNPGASGGSDRAVWVIERGVASTGLTFAFGIKQGGVSWLANPAPVPGAAAKVEIASSYAFFLMQVADKPFVVAMQIAAGGRVVDNSVRVFAGDSNHGFGTFWFGAKRTDQPYTAVRAGNVVTVTRTSGGSGLVAGGVTYFSCDQFSGIFPVATAVGASFTFNAPGADGALTNPGYAVPNIMGNLFNCIGGSENQTNSDNYAWAGSVANAFFRRGAVNTPGNLAPALLTGGVPNQQALADLANGRVAYAAMPGTDLYSHNLGDLTKAATGLNSTGVVATSAPVAVGTVMPADPITQPEYLRLDLRPVEWPHATALGKRTGSIRLTGTTNVATRSLYATVYSDPAMTILNLVKARHVCGYPNVNGTFSVETAEVPMRCGYWVKIESGDNPNVFAISGPHDVGPNYGVVSQSTLQVTFESTTGNSLAPVAANVGQFSVLHISGNVIDSPNNNYTNQAAFCRAAARRVRAAGQFGNGIVAAANKLLNLFNAALGVKVPLGFVHLCTSGHSVDTYINDRRALRNSIGNLVAGVAFNGTWSPRAAPYATSGSPVYTLVGSAKLYINGVLAATTDAAGNFVGNGFAGTFNFNTGAIAGLVSPVSGAAEIEATLFYNTVAASTAARKTDTTLTSWGDEAQSGVTGRVLERILAAKAWGGLTAIVFSWENYRVSHLGGLSDADAALHTAFMYRTLRTRLAAALGKDVPWIFMGDPRTTSFTSLAEHKARKFTRAFALAEPNTYYVPAPLTATMDAAVSPHAGANVDGGQFIGEVMAHGIAQVEALAGAVGEEVIPYAAVRVNASTIDIYVSRPVSYPAATLVTGAGGAVQGIYLGTTNANMLRIDPAAGADNAEALGGYTITIPSANVVRIQKNVGNIPSVYVNINQGLAFGGTITLNTLALQAAALDNTLFYNTGGFTAAARPGLGVQPSPDPIYVA